MYLVFINRVRHSIWNTKEEAEHQEKVLKDNGYKIIDIVEIDKKEYETGHYFV